MKDAACVHHADCIGESGLEDLHDQWVVGHHSGNFDRKLPSVVSSSLMKQAVFWVETKGKSLEEIDAIFEGEKHSSVPDIEMVRRGKEQVDVGVVEEELRSNQMVE